MAKQTFRVERGSQITVRATSSVHDIETVWNRMSGNIEVDPDDVAAGATADIVVNMVEFDAGDWLKNRKLKKDLELSKYPSARFILSELTGVTGSGQVSATAKGKIDWRNRNAEVSAVGTAEVSAERITAKASFELNVRELGVKPPRILMLKVEDIVKIEVDLVAQRA